MSDTKLIEQLEKLAFRTGDRSSADAAIIAAGAHEIERLTQQIAAVRDISIGMMADPKMYAVGKRIYTAVSPVTPESETN